MTLRMSEDWLRHHQRWAPAEPEHYVPRLQFPVKKLLNDSPLYQRKKLAREREHQERAS